MPRKEAHYSTESEYVAYIADYLHVDLFTGLPYSAGPITLATDPFDEVFNVESFDMDSFAEETLMEFDPFDAEPVDAEPISEQFSDTTESLTDPVASFQHDSDMLNDGWSGFSQQDFAEPVEWMECIEQLPQEHQQLILCHIAPSGCYVTHAIAEGTLIKMFYK